MAEQFEVGDVVVLNSGGPLMTVTHVDKDSGDISCRWFGQHTKHYINNLDPSTVQKPGKFTVHIITPAVPSESPAKVEVVGKVKT